jgi:hypothetical protein
MPTMILPSATARKLVGRCPADGFIPVDDVLSGCGDPSSRQVVFLDRDDSRWAFEYVDGVDGPIIIDGGEVPGTVEAYRVVPRRQWVTSYVKVGDGR